uniref:Uncharacterized protein n=1 Tax=Tetraselmis sp. GSL018 TaxID=582737 RepID=A0A061RXG5_9CHLO|mmetsp:Transcript_6737/g.16204  ORF Transcript_6737/g.16204 Transcript_6737/m.16204 type:complete len:99 (+) Transcript_6737:178-474(+)|eukprot:CAMPEP_0177606476 /NCGR_PEP_ID=MMETSP0419_2-20121207/17328_1 /TAXON_ID=582737 /ORGANISM="Tetraselmis sp., Strain GSL018" /LENGTH=98 /DNA_ID=CAMNT_0019100841 /DNA_START=86 /DNA_END=382 /DNA_ORIENTATION=-
MSSETASSVPATSHSKQKTEAGEVFARQAQFECDEESARSLEAQYRSEAVQEAFACKLQRDSELEAEWDAANAELQAALDAKVAAKTQREEAFQRKKT